MNQMRHLGFHAIKILQHSLYIHNTFEELLSIIRENPQMYGIFLKLSALFFLEEKNPRMTVENLYEKYSMDGDRLYYIDEMIESKIPIWDHVDGLVDTCDNQDGHDTLEYYISILLDCFE